MFGLSRKEKEKKAKAVKAVEIEKRKLEQDGLGDNAYIKLKAAASLRKSPDNLITAKLPRNGGQYSILVGWPDEKTPIGAMYSPEGRFIPAFQFDIALSNAEAKKYHIGTSPYGPDEYFQTYDIFLAVATKKIEEWTRFVR